MSRQLPVPVQRQSDERALAMRDQQSSASSSLARLAISLAPDILRATERIVLRRDEPSAATGRQVRGVRGQSYQISEVEIDTSIPFVRRVTVRNAASWTTLPVTEPEPEQSKRSRGKLIGLSGAAALIAAVMVRRAIPAGRVIDIQGRQRD